MWFQPKLTKSKTRPNPTVSKTCPTFRRCFQWDEGPAGTTIPSIRTQKKRQTFVCNRFQIDNWCFGRIKRKKQSKNVFSCGPPPKTKQEATPNCSLCENTLLRASMTMQDCSAITASAARSYDRQKTRAKRSPVVWRRHSVNLATTTVVKRAVNSIWSIGRYPLCFSSSRSTNSRKNNTETKEGQVQVALLASVDREELHWRIPTLSQPR